MPEGAPLPRLVRQQTALLIIDMQNDFVKPGGYLGKSGRDIEPVLEIIPNIQSILDFFRKNDLPRVFIKTVHLTHTNSPVWASRYGGAEAPPICLTDTWGSEIIEELRPEKDELVIIKHRYSALLDTNLPLILRSKSIRCLVIAGTQTNVCIDSTVRHAYMMDYLTITLRDCVATPDRELHEPSLRNLAKYFGYVASSQEVMEALSQA
ncbi:MAG: isochorismatase family cysteine hydrolase [Candidatus Caldarchaeum sp.]